MRRNRDRKERLERTDALVLPLGASAARSEAADALCLRREERDLEPEPWRVVDGAELSVDALSFDGAEATTGA